MSTPYANLELHCELKFTDAWKICLINVQTIVTSLDCILNESMPSQDQV